MNYKNITRTSVIVFAIMLVLIPMSGITASNPQVLRLATTTSMQDTGLLNQVIPAFEKEHNVKVNVIPVGSGEALRMGAKGDVDVLIAHSPKEERTFMDEGYGKDTKQIAHNYFVIVGPKNDPAGIKGMSAAKAFEKLARSNSEFVSRGDRSGTHMKEMEMWDQSGATRPSTLSAWYMETGKGMADTLRKASDEQAYTLTDIGTFLNERKNLNLGLLVDADKTLENKYDIITVNPAKHPDVNYDMAKTFMDYMASPEVQQKIGEFGKKEYGRPLFYPELVAVPAM
ncbi:ABC transporter permease [Methanocella sp. CWC-04]|uniref:ABC transporter permease n=1 Tax=Methanooceanicella nereidis TaxID=2052831 RepID=A0AAP2W6N5_9EURY|nr:substrate-binding domain-containing protein [Methanocella sp. CWC-04]MCD1295528.1 ABC transporter permease [Methanocella sp. CWC-04]